ncbi:MAG: hypothetical protein GEU93_07605 [Propionibacteriales bacterium]|nr:hypothetical protein [Propionibacteriales bacterium]
MSAAHIPGQLLLVDLGPRKPIRQRFRHVDRCCNCGAGWSFAWRRWHQLPVCGDCWGLDPAEAKGVRAC